MRGMQAHESGSGYAVVGYPLRLLSHMPEPSDPHRRPGPEHRQKESATQASPGGGPEYERIRPRPTQRTSSRKLQPVMSQATWSGR